MPDISTLVRDMTANGTLTRIARNRLAQFGTRTRRLIGAELLPAEDREENSYTDDTVRYRTVVANAGTRYSPVQLKKGVLAGSVDVRMFDTDIGSELTSRDYDALLRYLQRNQTLEATAQITNFLDTTVNQALEELREVYRWQAIEKALIQRRGHGGYAEDIAYSNPAGHRAVAAAAWSNNATDPMADIFNRVQLLSDKGFQVSRIISTRKVIGIMGLNAIMRARTGKIGVNVGGNLIINSGRASLAEVNNVMSAEGLPNIELYDLLYRTQTGTVRFISDNVMIFLGTTGRDANIDIDDVSGNLISSELLPDTLGYLGVGKATGQPTPGRVILAQYKEDRPPRVEAQGWETIQPVILEPEAIATISGIA